MAVASCIPMLPVVWCFTFLDSFVKNILKFDQVLVALGLSAQVSHARLYNPVPSIASSAARKIFLSGRASSPASANNLQSSIRLYKVAMGVDGSHGASSAISFSFSCLGLYLPIINFDMVE